MDASRTDTSGGHAAPRTRRALMRLAGMASLGVVLQGCDGGTRSPDAVRSEPDDPVDQALRQGRPAMIQFGANACAACREMKPVLAALQEDFFAAWSRGQWEALAPSLADDAVLISSQHGEGQGAADWQRLLAADAALLT